MGAGLGAALFLMDEGFLLGERLAAHAVQVELDQDPDFGALFVRSLDLCGVCER